LLFEKHLHHLEKVDPNQSKKDRKRRELQKLLNDTQGVSAQISALTLKKFQ